MAAPPLRFSASPTHLQADASSSHPLFRAAPATRSAAARLLAGWHLLSLDAPTVAALWVVFLARCSGLTLPWMEPAAMFVVVWMLYAADRLLDAREVFRAPQFTAAREKLEARHYFHHRYRARFSLLLCAAGVLLLPLLWHSSRSALRLHLLLGALLAGWLRLVHGHAPARRLPKELAVGVFFSAAVFVPTLARCRTLFPVLLAMAVLLAAVCSLNCLYIFAWEHPDDLTRAHASTRWAAERLTGATLLTMLICFATGLHLLQGHAARFTAERGLAFIAFACCASAASLLLLHRRRLSLAPLTLRASADICLLTPALLLPLWALLPRG